MISPSFRGARIHPGSEEKREERREKREERKEKREEGREKREENRGTGSALVVSCTSS